MHRKNLFWLLPLYRDGVNNYLFTNGLVEFQVSFCETLSNNACSVTTMATENNVIGDSCKYYLSGGSPSKDALISYIAANTSNPND